MATPNSIKIEHHTLELGSEYPPSNETETIEKLRVLLQLVHKSQPSGAAQRGQHVKQHGGVWATFRVHRDIPNEMRAGIFAEPQSYTALIRFSNGAPTDDDTKPAAHAMAIKVLVPNGGSVRTQQDFILADHPVFFARDVQHMFEFVNGKLNKTLNLKDFPAFERFTNVPTRGLLDMTYWSQTPYRLGSGAVKYLVKPSEQDEKIQLSPGSSPNFLREALTEQLTHEKVGAQYDFCVNPQTDAAAMPIEDPTREWTSSPVCLASIVIYPQKFDSAEQEAFFTNLSWSPWNVLPEHSPLGGINRARKIIYEDSSLLRHTTAGVEGKIPTGRESF
jgi:hypothetical protein